MHFFWLFHSKAQVRPHSIVDTAIPDYQSGNANTLIELPVRGGWGSSGVSSAGTLLAQVELAMPVGIAMYCLPSTL
tara:strand:+ start:396 stop:623 length:228 start_codon:yes stop_codon:yes gene_type:complete